MTSKSHNERNGLYMEPQRKKLKLQKRNIMNRVKLTMTLVQETNMINRPINMNESNGEQKGCEKVMDMECAGPE